MIVDSHCHLDFPPFSSDRADVIERARKAGVGCMLTIATSLEAASATIQIADSFPGVVCAVGTHPHGAAQATGKLADDYLKFASHPKVVAIGECGLDFHGEQAPLPVQAAAFEVQIEAARQSGLPVIVHNRNADSELMDLMERQYNIAPFGAVLHCFSADRRVADWGVELGFYISFSGILTFKNARDIQEIAKSIPSDRLLVETDAPYLAPDPNRGRRNEPAFVRHTLSYLADLRDCGFEDMKTITTENFFRLFPEAWQHIQMAEDC